jgi:HEAT repeat protein
LDSRKAVDPLIDLLQDDNVTVRHHAVGALGRLGSKRALKPIENLIKTESDINVVTAAKNAYKQITGDDWKGD